MGSVFGEIETTRRRRRPPDFASRKKIMFRRLLLHQFNALREASPFPAAPATMSGVRGKRSRGGDVRTDNDATTGSNPAVNDGVPNGAPPGTSSRPNETNQQQKRHSVDTVLAQAGFVGHRTDASHATGNNGFLGDTTGSLIPPIFPSTTYARDTSRGGYDLRHLVTYPKDEIAEHHHVDGEKNDNYDAKHQNEGATHQPTPRPLMYSRPDNPGYTQAESLIASLEGGENALLFSSGMAAVAAVAASTLKHGDRCAIPKNCYFAVRVFFQDYCRRNGVECYLYDDSHEDMTRAAYGLSREEFESNQKQCETMEKLSPVLVDWGAFKNDEKCKLIWVETPSNPTWRVTNIQKASQLAKILRATLCCDNTVLTPLCCRPLSLGADLVMHSATKYLNGHSDVVAGVVVGRKVDWRDWRAGDDPDDTYKICLRQVGKSFQSITDADQFTVFQFLQKTRSFGGAVLGPFEAWLLVRGLRTLHVRVRAQCARYGRMGFPKSRHRPFDAPL
jgi:cystathionine beta-lyase/cystathionine gamma-synthase